jgi:hypothetical protein
MGKQASSSQPVLIGSSNSNEKLTVANNRKKMNETKTVQFFTIENNNQTEATPFDPATGIFLSQSEFSQLKSAKVQP